MNEFESIPTAKLVDMESQAEVNGDTAMRDLLTQEFVRRAMLNIGLYDASKDLDSTPNPSEAPRRWVTDRLDDGNI